MLRDWTTSEAVDSLSPQAEVFFTRLIMKADDYGSFHASPKLIRAALFPLKDYDLSQIQGWLSECVKASLITSYEAAGKSLIRINNFNQRLQNKRGLFPAPGESPGVTGSDRKSPPELEVEDRIEVEIEVQSEIEIWPTFDQFWNLYDKKADKPKCEKKWNKLTQGAREKIMFHVEEYVKATPDKNYRKNPYTYLYNESWNDEIIRNGKSTTKTHEEHLADAARYILGASKTNQPTG